VENLAELADSSGAFDETCNAQTGEPDGGWQTGSHWASEPDQTWSATAYLRMVYDYLFGMDFTTSGITFQPTLPAGWGNVTLTGVQYRGATLNIDLQGSGKVISSFTIDGTTTTNDSIPATPTGTHTVTITLTGGQPGAVTGQAGLCMDVRGASTANATPVQLYGTSDGTLVDRYECNATGAQIWVPQANGELLNPQIRQVPRRPEFQHHTGHPARTLGLQRRSQPEMDAARRSLTRTLTAAPASQSHHATRRRRVEIGDRPGTRLSDDDQSTSIH
jgi:hypothetical protein